MRNEKILKLCEYIEKNKGMNYPIENEELNSATDFIKNSYLKMLAVLLQQGDKVSEGQLNLFRRIWAGVKADYTIEDYLRQALDIEVGDYANFIAECKENNIKYRFILDGMLLVSSECLEENSYQLLASFCDALQLKREEVKYLAILAKAVLELDGNYYVDLELNKAESIPGEILRGYFNLLPIGKICSNAEWGIVRPMKIEEATLEIIEQINELHVPCVQITDVVFDLGVKKLMFQGKKKVVIKNCAFKGGAYPIFIDTCEEVLFENCSFEGFSSYALQLKNVGDVRIVRSNFTDCIFRHSSDGDDWLELGGVIHSSKSKNNTILHLDRCCFNRCGGCNSENYYRSAFLSNCICKANACSFVECWHMNSRDKIDPEGSCRTMFTQNSTYAQCSFENSARFN